MVEELFAGLSTNLAGRHSHSADADFVAGLRHVDGVFEKDDGIVVGEGDAATTQLLGGGAMISGVAASARVSTSRDLLMSQFWQNLQAKLHPAVPKESTGVPGRK